MQTVQKKANNNTPKKVVVKKATTKTKKKIVLGGMKNAIKYIAPDAFEPMELVPTKKGWIL